MKQTISRILLSSFHPNLFKLADYVYGHNVSKKLNYHPKYPRTSLVIALYLCIGDKQWVCKMEYIFQHETCWKMEYIFQHETCWNMYSILHTHCLSPKSYIYQSHLGYRNKSIFHALIWTCSLANYVAALTFKI